LLALSSRARIIEDKYGIPPVAEEFVSVFEIIGYDPT
jgi:hypothetical protein